LLFARNVELQPGEDSSIIKAWIEDSARRVFPLAVEYAGKVSGADWLTQVVVRLPDGIENTGDARVSLEVRGLPSNKALVSIKSF
jgi:hypothetical protein